MNMAKVLGIALLLGQFAFADSANVAPATDSLARQRLLKKLQNEDDLRSLCSGLKVCMDMDFPGCSVGDKHPWPKTKYNDEFCKPYKELEIVAIRPIPILRWFLKFTLGLDGNTVSNMFITVHSR
jgi:hypothetical protein